MLREKSQGIHLPFSTKEGKGTRNGSTNDSVIPTLVSLGVGKVTDSTQDTNIHNTQKTTKSAGSKNNVLGFLPIRSQL